MRETESRPEPRPRRRLSAADLLDREEAYAVGQIAEATRRVGDDVCNAFALRERIRAHPFVSVAVAAAAGFVGGAPLLRTMAKLSALALPAFQTARSLLGRQRSLFEPNPPVSARVLEKLRVRDTLRTRLR